MTNLHELLIPKEINVYAFLVNELAISTINANDRDYTVLYNLLYNNETFVTPLTITGEMKSIMFSRSYQPDTYTSVYKNSSWLQILLIYLHDAYASRGITATLTTRYMEYDGSLNINTAGYIRNLPLHIIRSVGALFDIMLCSQNYWEKIANKNSAFERIDIEVHRYFDLKASRVLLSSKQHDTNLVNSVSQSSNNTNVSAFLSNIDSTKVYYPVFAQITGDYSALGFLKYTIMPLIVFVEYAFTREAVESALQRLESVMTISPLRLEEIPKISHMVLELLYASLKLTYEQQKSYDVMRFVQVYTPALLAKLEEHVRTYNVYRSYNYTTKTPAYAFLLMPYLHLVNILGKLPQYAVSSFIEILASLEGDPSMLPLQHTQLLASYYSKQLSDILRKLDAKSEEVNLHEISLLNQLIRVILTIPAITYDRWALVENMLPFQYKHRILENLDKRITKDSLLIINRTFTPMRSNRQYRIVISRHDFVSGYRINVGYCEVYSPDANLPCHKRANIDYKQYIPAPYRSLIDDILDFDIGYTVCEVH